MANPFGIRHKYAKTVPLIYILLPGIFLFCIATILAAYFAGTKKLMVNFSGSLLGFVVVVGLNLFLIPDLGITGAAIPSLLAYSITTFMLFFYGVFTGEQRY